MPASRVRAVLDGSKLRGRRRRAQRPVLAAIAALAFLLGAAAAGLAGFVGGVSNTAVSSTLADVPVSERVFQLSARVADDPQAQDAAATAAFDRYVGEAPYDLHRSLLTEPRQLLDPATPEAEGADDGLSRIALAAYESLPDHAELVAGTWPADAADSARTPVALHQEAAAAFGVEVGDELAFIERRLLGELIVVGLWRPSAPADDYWFGSDLEIAGLDNTGDGLAVVSEAALLEMPGPVPVVRWRLVPDLDALSAVDLGVLRVGLTNIRPALADDTLFRGAGIGVDDDVITGLEGVDSALLATRSVAVAPLLLAVVAAAGAIALLSRLLVENRQAETLLLRGRGWSRAQATVWALRESVWLVVLPTATGGLAGYAVLQAAVGDAEVPPGLVAGAAGIVIVMGVLTLTLSAARAAGPAHVTVEQRATASRRQIIGRAGAVVLAFAAAALSAWQLRRYGGVTVTDAQGIERIDPLAVAAPAAMLLAAGLVGMITMAAVGRVAARVLGAGRGLSGVHAARVLGRRPAAYVLPVLLLALAAGSAALAAGYTKTWHDLQSDAAVGRTAADVEVELSGSRLMTTAFEPIAVQDYRDIDGVRDLATATSVPAALGDGQVELVADTDGSAGSGVELPTGASVIDLEISSDLELSSNTDDGTVMRGPDGEPVMLSGDVAVWLVDAAGSGGFVVSPLTLATAGSDNERVRFDAPEGGEPPWRIVAVDFRLEVPVEGPLSAGEVTTGPAWQADFSLSLAGVMVDGFSVEVPDERWDAVANRSVGDDAYDVTGAGDATGRLTGLVPESSFGEPVELGTRIVHGPDTVAVAATGAALDRHGLAEGGQASIDVLGAAVPIEIADRTLSISGTSGPEAMTTDLHDLIAAVLRAAGQPPAANRIWLMTDPAADQSAIADAASATAGPESSVASRAVIETELIDARLSQLVIAAFWLVSGVAIGLAVIGVWAGAATSLSARRVEVGVFRALGFSASQQGRQRRRELLLVGWSAIALGCAAGLAAGWVAVPALVRSATPGLAETIEPAMSVSWPLVGASVAVLAMFVVVIVAGYGARVRRQARATLGVEVAG